MLVCVAGDADMEELPFLRRQGRSNKEIATDLHIELQTVKNHLRSLFTKAQHLSRTQAQPITTAPASLTDHFHCQWTSGSLSSLEQGRGY